MTTDAIIARLQAILTSDDAWQAKDEALGKPAEDILIAAHAYLRMSIVSLAADLKVGR